MIAFEGPAAARPTDRILELVWLAPVGIAAVVTLATARHLAIVAPLVLVALVPWIAHAARRALPVWVFGALAIAPVLAITVIDGLDASVFLGTTALCILASRAGRPWQLGVVVVIAVALPFASAFGPGPFDQGSFYFAIGDLFGVAVGVLLGYSVRLSAELRLASERLLEASAQEERTRLARDVHDLVAHSLTVVVLHVGGARRLIRTDPARAEEALEQAERTCRDSLDGVRRVVGLLRTSGDLHGDPGDLPGLLAVYREAGVEIRAALDEATESLPLFVRSVLHRVAAEALANAARYRTPDSVVEVTIVIDGDRVSLVVENTAEGRLTGGGGFGLVGLREQVQEAGGTLMSSAVEGRWRVECRLPITPTAETAA